MRAQQGDPDSLLSFYKKLIRLRKDPQWADTAVYGRTVPLMEEKTGLMAYLRKGEDRDLLVLGNFNAKALTLSVRQLLSGGWMEESGGQETLESAPVLINNDDRLDLEGDALCLGALQAVVIGIVHKNDK